MDPRRRVPRISTDNWPGRCSPDGEPHWELDCEVVDLSLLGVGILLRGDAHTVREGQRLVVWVYAPIGGSVSLRLVGHVRNLVPTEGGRTRVGMEFVDLSETEQAILQVFEIMKVFW